VSIVVPAHGRPDELRECLRSVGAQTYRPLQLIVVDDASVDPIDPVVTGVGWPQDIEVHVRRLEQNGGPGHAREVGRSMATGRYIAYLDADDWWDADTLAKQVTALEQDPAASMAYCATVVSESIADAGGGTVRPRSDQAFDALIPELLHGRPWSTSSCLWRRSATDRIGPWSDLRTWEDYEHDCRAGCLGMRIVFVPGTVSYLRRTSSELHLSNRPPRDVGIDRARARLAMASELRRAGLAAAPDIGAPVVRLLVGSVIDVLGFGDRATARALVRAIASVSRRGWRDPLVVSLGAAAGLPGTDVGLRVARWARRRWAPSDQAPF